MHRVVFSPDEALVAVITNDLIVHFWDADMTDEKATFNNVGAVTFSQDGGMVALQMGRDYKKGLVRVLETNMWVDKATFNFDRGEVGGFKFSPNNPVLGWIVKSPTEDSSHKFLHFENLETGKVLPEIRCPAETWTMKFSPNGEFVIFPAEDDSYHSGIVLLEVATGNQRCLSEGLFNPNRLAFNPDSSQVATLSFNGDIHITGTSTGETKHTLRPDASDDPLFDHGRLAFSPTGKIAAMWPKDTLDQWTIQLWDALTGDEIGKLPIECDASRFSFSNDGAHLVTEMGLLPLPPASPWISSDGLPEGTQDCLYVGRQWIVQGFGNLLWLPPAYHTGTHTTAVRGNSVVLGHRSGRITVFEFDLSNTPLVRRPQEVPI